MHQNGFTLTELILVIALLGILAVVATPRFHAASSWTAFEYATELRAALRHARSLALASGCRVRLQHDSSGFALQRDADCLSGTSDFTASVADPSGAAYQRSLPAGLASSPASFAITFDALGRASSSLSIGLDTQQVLVLHSGLVQ